MQKRTTNYSFQKFGDVFYSVNHNAGHLIDYVENDFKITNKTFDSFYYSSDPVYLDTRSGIIMLVVSKDGKKFEEYVIHRVVRLKPDIYFNYVFYLKRECASNSLFKSWNESEDDGDSVFVSAFGFKDEFKRDFYMFLPGS